MAYIHNLPLSLKYKLARQKWLVETDNSKCMFVEIS